MNVSRWFYLTFFWLFSCDGAPPLAPTYDDSCTPSHTYYLKIARSDEDLIPKDKLPSKADESLALAVSYLDENGISMIEKDDTFPNKDMSMALPTVIVLAQDFWSRPVYAQATTLWHEIAHIHQWKRFGKPKMSLLVIKAEGRWAIETVAYRQSIRSYAALGYSRDSILKYADSTFEMLYDRYDLSSIPKHCAYKNTMDVWMKEIPE
jgi:hypothetical protein